MPFLAISATFAYLLNYLANDMEKIQKCTLSIIYENYLFFIALKLSGEKQKKKTFGLDAKLAPVWLVVSSRSSLAREMTKLCMLLLYLVLF